MNAPFVAADHVCCYCLLRSWFQDPKQMLPVHFRFSGQCLCSGTHNDRVARLQLRRTLAAGFRFGLLVQLWSQFQRRRSIVPLIHRADVLFLLTRAPFEILLHGVWWTTQLKCVFTCGRRCWQRESQDQQCTGAQLVQRCPKATHYWSIRVYDVPAAPPTDWERILIFVLFRISNTIALLQKKKKREKIKHSTFCFCSWLVQPRETIWSPLTSRKRVLLVLLFVIINSSGRVLTWSRMSWVTVCPCSTSRAPPPLSISTTAKTAVRLDWARTSSQVGSAVPHPDNTTSSPDEGTE